MRMVVWELVEEHSDQTVLPGYSAWDGVPYAAMDALWDNVTQTVSDSWNSNYWEAVKWDLMGLSPIFAPGVEAGTMRLEKGQYVDTSPPLTYRSLSNPEWEAQPRQDSRYEQMFSHGSAIVKYGQSPLFPGNNTITGQANLSRRIPVWFLPQFGERSTMFQTYRLDRGDVSLRNLTVNRPNKINGYSGSLVTARWQDGFDWYTSVDWVVKEWTPKEATWVWGYSKPVWTRLENWLHRGAFFGEETVTQFSAHDVFYPILQDILDEKYYQAFFSWTPDYTLQGDGLPWYETDDTYDFDWQRSGVFDVNINDNSDDSDWVFWLALIPSKLNQVSNYWNSRPSNAQNPSIPSQGSGVANLSLYYMSQSMPDYMPITSADVSEFNLFDDDEEVL